MSQIRQYSRARIAITTAFIINGSIAGTFYSRIADIKEQLNLSNSALGFALLVVSVGVLVGLGFSGVLEQATKPNSNTQKQAWHKRLVHWLINPAWLLTEFMAMCLSVALG